MPSKAFFVVVATVCACWPQHHGYAVPQTCPLQHHNATCRARPPCAQAVSGLQATSATADGAQHSYGSLCVCHACTGAVPRKPSLKKRIAHVCFPAPACTTVATSVLDWQLCAHPARTGSTQEMFEKNADLQAELQGLR